MPAAAGISEVAVFVIMVLIWIDLGAFIDFE